MSATTSGKARRATKSFRMGPALFVDVLCEVSVNYGFLVAKPTLNDTDTLRPGMTVRRSSGLGAAVADFAVPPCGTPVIAWLSVRLFTASRIRDCESLDEPRTV